MIECVIKCVKQIRTFATQSVITSILAEGEYCVTLRANIRKHLQMRNKMRIALEILHKICFNSLMQYANTEMCTQSYAMSCVKCMNEIRYATKRIHKNTRKDFATPRRNLCPSK